MDTYKQLFRGLGVMAVMLVGFGCSTRIPSAVPNIPGNIPATPPEILVVPAPAVNLCVGQADEVGNFPTAAAYRHLDVLGQIFTADDCGSDRLVELWGGMNVKYKYESVLFLKEQPPSELLDVLQSLGFVCYGTKITPCRQWQNEGAAPTIIQYLRLKPYAPAIEAESKHAIVFKSTDNVCTVAPFPNDIGNISYPIAPKYWDLLETGQLLTAKDCGATRFAQFEKDGGFETTQGGAYLLRAAPSQGLRAVFKDIGFQCDTGDEATCVEWRLRNFEVTSQDMLRVAPYVNEMKAEGCASCG